MDNYLNDNTNEDPQDLNDVLFDDLDRSTAVPEIDSEAKSNFSAHQIEADARDAQEKTQNVSDDMFVIRRTYLYALLVPLAFLAGLSVGFLFWGQYPEVVYLPSTPQVIVREVISTPVVNTNGQQVAANPQQQGSEPDSETAANVSGENP